jgi:predicted DNA-binding transcriptional regulator AlpA
MDSIFHSRYLRLSQIIGDKRGCNAPIIPISKSSWWNGVRAGKYPKPHKLGPRTTVWLSEEVFALLGNGEATKND